jgi:hypothetical protein
VQAGLFVDIRSKEYKQHILLEYPDGSALAEHNIGHEHRVQFHNSSILTTKTRHMGRIDKEAIEIELHPYNINRESDFFSVKHASLLSAP